MSKVIKKHEDWEGSLDDYLKIGDLVDLEMVNYFINVLPPATWNHKCIQIGEANSHVNGRATYSTLVSTLDGWMYAGNCHKGEILEPKEDGCND